MLNREEQRRLDEMALQLRTTDPEFVARMGDREPSRRARALIAVSVVLWAAVPALAYVGGWIATAATAAVLTVAAPLVLMPPTKTLRRAPRVRRDPAS
jgi:hypothetical protein